MLLQISKRQLNHTNSSQPLAICFFMIHMPRSPLKIMIPVSMAILVLAYFIWFSNFLLCFPKVFSTILNAFYWPQMDARTFQKDWVTYFSFDFFYFISSYYFVGTFWSVLAGAGVYLDSFISYDKYTFKDLESDLKINFMLLGLVYMFKVKTPSLSLTKGFFMTPLTSHPTKNPSPVPASSSQELSIQKTPLILSIQGPGQRKKFSCCPCPIVKVKVQVGIKSDIVRANYWMCWVQRSTYSGSTWVQTIVRMRKKSKICDNCVEIFIFRLNLFIQIEFYLLDYYYS